MSPKLKQLTKQQEATVKRPFPGSKVEFIDIHESESGVLFVDYMVTTKNQYTKQRQHRVAIFAKVDSKLPPSGDILISVSVIDLIKKRKKGE